MRRTLRIGILLFAVYAVVSIVAGIFLAYSTLHPYHRPLPPSAESNMSQIAAGLRSQMTDVQIPAFDDAPLRAWYIQPRSDNGNAVILLHGLGDNRLGMRGYAEMFLNHGYSVLMPDARAHGARRHSPLVWMD
jgi:cephalosporin-C deacetylase-like acetyl esterase